MQILRTSLQEQLSRSPRSSEGSPTPSPAGEGSPAALSGPGSPSQGSPVNARTRADVLCGASSSSGSNSASPSPASCRGASSPSSADGVALRGRARHVRPSRLGAVPSAGSALRAVSSSVLLANTEHPRAAEHMARSVSAAAIGSGHQLAGGAPRDGAIAASSGVLGRDAAHALQPADAPACLSPGSPVGQCVVPPSSPEWHSRFTAHRHAPLRIETPTCTTPPSAALEPSPCGTPSSRDAGVARASLCRAGSRTAVRLAHTLTEGGSVLQSELSAVLGELATERDREHCGGE